MAKETKNPESDRAYHAMRDGRLTYQKCRHCEHAWLPERTECPNCLQNEIDRLDASGVATLISWVVFHRSFVPAFKDSAPYTAAIVELAEGPRLISNIVAVDNPEQLMIDQTLALRVVRQNNAQVPVFAPADGSGTKRASRQ